MTDTHKTVGVRLLGSTDLLCDKIKDSLPVYKTKQQIYDEAIRAMAKEARVCQ